jgi:hypothetical protein
MRYALLIYCVLMASDGQHQVMFMPVLLFPR